jgi:hypothetical protein
VKFSENIEEIAGLSNNAVFSLTVDARANTLLELLVKMSFMAICNLLLGYDGNKIS